MIQKKFISIIVLMPKKQKHYFLRAKIKLPIPLCVQHSRDIITQFLINIVQKCQASFCIFLTTWIKKNQ